MAQYISPPSALRVRCAEEHYERIAQGLNTQYLQVLHGEAPRGSTSICALIREVTVMVQKPSIVSLEREEGKEGERTVSFKGAGLAELVGLANLVADVDSLLRSQYISMSCGRDDDLLRYGGGFYPRVPSTICTWIIVVAVSMSQNPESNTQMVQFLIYYGR